MMKFIRPKIITLQIHLLPQEKQTWDKIKKLWGTSNDGTLLKLMEKEL